MIVIKTANYIKKSQALDNVPVDTNVVDNDYFMMRNDELITSLNNLQSDINTIVSESELTFNNIESNLQQLSAVVDGLAQNQPELANIVNAVRQSYTSIDQFGYNLRTRLDEVVNNIEVIKTDINNV